MIFSNNSGFKYGSLGPVALVLFIGSVIYLAIVMTRYDGLEESLEKERLSSELMLSEKLLLEKEMAKVKSDYKAMREQKYVMEGAMISVSGRLESTEKELSKLQAQDRQGSQLKNENKELKSQVEASEQRKFLVSYKLDSIENSNDDLNLMVALLQQQNGALKAELNARNLSTMNQTLVEMTKRNDKLTVRAASVKKITVNVDVPVTTSVLSLKITSPSGQEINGEDGAVTVNTKLEKRKRYQPTYGAGQQSELSYNWVEMVYSPKVKLVKGLYTIEVLNDSSPIGSLQVKLR